MSAIDPGLLPGLGREIYGTLLTVRKRSHRLDPGYETDIEDNRTPRSSSIFSRPNQTFIALGALTTPRSDDKSQGPQYAGKHKRRSHGENHFNINTSSYDGAPSAQPQRRYSPLKCACNTNCAASRVNSHTDAMASQEYVTGYMADDEMRLYQHEKL